MKNLLHKPLRLLFLSLFVLFINSLAHANLYTATASGNWSNPSTWGGVVPETELKDNQVLIPVGITVTMDVDVFMNGTPVVLEVDGTLLANPNSIFTASWGLISGSGIITLDNMEINGGTKMIFDGVLNAKSLTNGLADFTVEADVNVLQSLVLTNGKMTLIDKGSLTVGTNVDIVITHGSIILNGGSLELNNPYNVNYTNESSDAGVELTGPGLNNVLINVQDSASKVVLSTDLKLSGILNLMNGTLALNGHDLRIEGHLGINGNGIISSSGISNIIVSTKDSPLGSLKLLQGENTVNNLTVNIEDGSKLVIDSDINIVGSLEFQSGKLDIGNHKISMEPNALITGAKLGSYIITNEDGSLSMNIKSGVANKVFFPVGTSFYYAPAQLTLSPGSKNIRLNVNASKDVLEHAISGKDLSVAQPLVDVTWNISSDTSVKVINLNADLMWPVNAEVNGFNRKKAYESEYLGAAWDKITPKGAIDLGNGLFSISRDNISSLTAMAVFDESAVTEVFNIDIDAQYVIYPNPSQSTLYLRNKTNLNFTGKAEVLNLNCQLIKSVKLINTTESISIDDLNAGIYFLKITGNGFNEVKRFVKQ